jgi:hypothetical protein
VKWHWIKQCCNKFEKPTGVPGDPKSDMILRCQRIQQRIHAKTASVIMGVDSGGDEGLSVSDDEEESLEEEEEEVVAAVVEEMVADVLVGGIGLVTNSIIGAPTNFVVMVVVLR